MTAIVRDMTNEKEIALDIRDELQHAILVSNLAYAVGKELELDDKVCYELALAGMVHDIGKLRLTGYINGQGDALEVEELKYDRMHSQLGYEELVGRGYSQFVLDCVLYHHENYDGSGFPGNLRGEEIPYGARILRVCDEYAALRTDRPYRKAFDVQSAMELMIEDIMKFDMKVFLAFQRAIHNKTDV